MWFRLWEDIVARYKNNSLVVGCDLRNELRATVIDGKPIAPTWFVGNKTTDWRTAAITLSNRLLAINPNLLLFIEGINYALDLSGVATSPITNSDVRMPNRIVYSCHQYAWDSPWGVNTTLEELQAIAQRSWSFVLQAPILQPLWLGEFGIAHSDNIAGLKSSWWQSMVAFVKSKTALHWSYWSIDGTQSSGSGRKYGTPDSFGLLNRFWNTSASKELTRDLQSMMT
jgi:endoglucanase